MQDVQGLASRPAAAAWRPYSADIDISRHSVWRQQRAGRSPLPLRSWTPPTSLQASPSSVRHSSLGRVHESRRARQLATFASTSAVTTKCCSAESRCFGGNIVHKLSILSTLRLVKETIRGKLSSLIGTFTTSSSMLSACECKMPRRRGMRVRGWRNGPEDLTTSTFSN